MYKKTRKITQAIRRTDDLSFLGKGESVECNGERRVRGGKTCRRENYKLPTSILLAVRIFNVTIIHYLTAVARYTAAAAQYCVGNNFGSWEHVVRVVYYSFVHQVALGYHTAVVHTLVCAHRAGESYLVVVLRPETLTTYPRHMGRCTAVHRRVH